MYSTCTCTSTALTDSFLHVYKYYVYACMYWCNVMYNYILIIIVHTCTYIYITAMYNEYVPSGRHRSKQIYEQEMLLGFIELSIDKVVMFGIAGSGKTCSLAALLGLDPPDLRCSTPLMQRPIEVVVIHVDDQLHWQKKTPEQIRETVAEIIRSRMSVHQTEAKSSASPDTPGQQPPHTTDSQTPR